MKRMLLFAAALLLAAAAMPGLIFAQGDDLPGTGFDAEQKVEKKKVRPAEGKSQAFTLGEIVVSDVSMNEGPATMHVVTEKDIKRQNAQTTGEALALVPGAYFRQARYQSGFYLTLRGFEQENVLVLLDGVPLNAPYDGLINLNDIPAQQISSIKVVKGSPSLLYGTNGLGGVVNIISKKGTEVPSLSVNYQQAQHRTIHAGAGHGWKIGSFSYYLSASHQESNGYPLAEKFSFPDDITAAMLAVPKPGTDPARVAPGADDNIRNNSDYKRNSVSFTGNYDFSLNHRLGLSLEYYKNEYGVPPVAIFNEVKSGGLAGQYRYFPRFWRWTDWERFTANLIEESRLFDTLRIRARLFYDSYDSAVEAYDDENYSAQNRISPPSFTSSYNDYSAGYNLYAFWTGLKNNTLRLGASGKQDVHREDYADVDGSEPETKMVSRSHAFTSEDELVLFRILTLTGGASWNYFDKRELVQPDASAVQDVGDDMSALSWQGGARVTIADGTDVYASFARRVRFPTMRNLYSSGATGPLGDPELQEQVSYNSELGCNVRVAEWLSLEGALFHSRVRDMINFDNQIGRFEQYGKVNIAGVEASVVTKLRDIFFGRISYTYLYARNDSVVTINNVVAAPYSYEPEELPYRPAHKVDADLALMLPFGTGLSVNGSYISERVYYDKAEGLTTSIVAHRETLDGYFLVNAKISQKIWKTEAYIMINNLFNQEYDNLYLVPGKGRVIWAGASMEL